MITTSLNSLAGNIPTELIAALVENEIWIPAPGLAYVRQKQDDNERAEGLRLIAPLLPAALLTEALDAARRIGSESDRARALAGLLTRFTFEPSFWQKILHALASLNRESFLQNLPPLAPLIMQLGGMDSIKEVVKALGDVSR